MPDPLDASLQDGNDGIFSNIDENLVNLSGASAPEASVDLDRRVPFEATIVGKFGEKEFCTFRIIKFMATTFGKRIPNKEIKSKC